MTARGLAASLGPFGIRTRKGRWPDLTAGARAYVLSDFEQAFARYLSEAVGVASATSATASDGTDLGGSTSATGTGRVADVTSRKSSDGTVVADVAHSAHVPGDGADEEDEDEREVFAL